MAVAADAAPANITTAAMTTARMCSSRVCDALRDHPCHNTAHYHELSFPRAAAAGQPGIQRYLRPFGADDA
jgi:hypothetical protein